jgi:thiol:disulfide interchange protein DsbD
MKGLKVKGNITEQKPIIAHDPNFGATLGYHENQVEFRQKIKIKKLKSFSFKVYYMVCDDSQCLPPTEVTIEVKIP